MKKYVEHIKFVLLFGGIVFLFAFGTQRNNERTITTVEVVFKDAAHYFIDLDAVNKLLIQNKDTITNVRKEALALSKLEKLLDSNPMIQKSEVYITIDGVLGATIQQRKPVARVIDSDNFYIDAFGKKMPLSTLHTARVPLVSGFEKEDYKTLVKLIDKINQDDLMRHLIVGIDKSVEKKIRLLPRKYDFYIEFGEVTNIDKKFQNFKAFFQKTVKDSTITNYKSVALQLNNQVVATRK